MLLCNSEKHLTRFFESYVALCLSSKIQTVTFMCIESYLHCYTEYTLGIDGTLVQTAQVEYDAYIMENAI